MDNVHRRFGEETYYTAYTLVDLRTAEGERYAEMKSKKRLDYTYTNANIHVKIHPFKLSVLYAYVVYLRTVYVLFSYYSCSTSHNIRLSSLCAREVKNIT